MWIRTKHLFPEYGEKSTRFTSFRRWRIVRDCGSGGILL
jgi:hypothetical protein